MVEGQKGRVSYDGEGCQEVFGYLWHKPYPYRVKCKKKYAQHFFWLHFSIGDQRKKLN